MFELFLVIGDSVQIGGLEIISETRSTITGIGLEKIECHPNIFQTLIALLRLRTLRMFRDIQKLYFMILLPLGLAALALYFNSIQSIQPKIQAIVLNGETYGNDNTLAVHNASNRNLDAFYDQLENFGVRQLDEYNGNFSLLLQIAPHMAAFNINNFQYPDYSITVIYNDTMQHSLPILINLISNSIYRYFFPNETYIHMFIITNDLQTFKPGKNSKRYVGGNSSVCTIIPANGTA